MTKMTKMTKKTKKTKMTKNDKNDSNDKKIFSENKKWSKKEFHKKIYKKLSKTQ